METWRIELQRASFSVTLGGSVFQVGLACQGVDAGIPVPPGRLPARFNWIQGLRRLSGGAVGVGSARAVLTILMYLFDFGGSVPLVWQCSRRDAGVYMRLFSRAGFKAGVVYGSMAGDAPLTHYGPDTGGSEDEQICMVEQTW